MEKNMHDTPYTPERSAKDPAALRGFILRKAVVKQAAIMVKDEQAALHRALADGDTVAVADQEGRKLGTVSRSFPTPRAKVTDPDVVLQNTPEAERDLYFKDDDLPEVYAIIAAEAPHLLYERPSEDYLAREAKAVAKRWEARGEDTPGWTVSRPEGTTSARVNSLADSAALRLLEGINAPQPELENTNEKGEN